MEIGKALTERGRLKNEVKRKIKRWSNGGVGGDYCEGNEMRNKEKISFSGL